MTGGRAQSDLPTEIPVRLDFEDLYDHAPAAYVTTMPDGLIVHVNATFVDWTGRRAEDLVGKRRFADLLPRGIRAFYATHHLPALETAGFIREDSSQIVCADGHRLPVLLSSTMRYDADGAPTLIHTAITDATAGQRYEREVRAARDRERAAREHTERLLADHARLTRKEAAVAGLAHLALTGADPAELVDAATVAVSTALGIDDVVVLEPGDVALEDPVPPGGTRVPIGDAADPYRILAVTPTDRLLLPETHAFLQTVVGVLWLAIERHRLHERDRHRALHDPLTGLPNRVLLQDRLEHALARARRGGAQVAVLLLDLDGFKVANDTLGHHAGDLILRAVGERLAAHVRSSDTVARLGGDEFVVVCEDLPDEGHAQETAARIGAAIAAPVPLDGGSWQVGASIGIAVAGAGTDAETLLRQADRAMYAVKERRRTGAAVD